MVDEPQDKADSLWEKVSDSVIKGLKTGKSEIVRTSKMGKIRLEISSVKSRIGDRQKELGAQVYNLWVNEKVDVPELEEMFDRIKQLEDEIKQKEREIERLIEEKEKPEEKPMESEVHVEEPPPAATQEKVVAEAKKEEPAAEQKVAKKALAKKGNTEDQTTDTKSEQQEPKLEGNNKE